MNARVLSHLFCAFKVFLQWTCAIFDGLIGLQLPEVFSRGLHLCLRTSGRDNNCSLRVWDVSRGSTPLATSFYHVSMQQSHRIWCLSMFAV